MPFGSKTSESVNEQSGEQNPQVGSVINSTQSEPYPDQPGSSSTDSVTLLRDVKEELRGLWRDFERKRGHEDTASESSSDDNGESEVEIKNALESSSNKDQDTTAKSSWDADSEANWKSKRQQKHNTSEASSSGDGNIV